MTTTRRTLIGAGLAGGAAAALSGCSDDEPEPAGQPAPGTGPASASTAAEVSAFDPQDWDSVQAQFLLDPSKAQFAAFVLSPHTHVLDAAIAGYRDELGADTEAALVTDLEREDATRSAAAAYHGGAAGQYALTDSTTMGLGLMYGGLTLGPGDEVLTTQHDFYSTEASLQLLRQRTGATIRQVKLYDDPAQATVDEMVGRLAAGITDRTKVVAHHLGPLEHRRPRPGAGDLRRAGRDEPGAAQPVRRVRRRRARLLGRRRRTCRTSAATSSRRAPTSGCSVRAAPGSCGVGPSTR